MSLDFGSVIKKGIQMKTKILKKLEEIESTYDVKIIYACESGSRAWGFESTDSDYDVRFVYVHPEDWYLSAFPKRDVIEEPINDLLDFSGWELRKALQLAYKSNPALMEWIHSPVVYKQRPEYTLFRETVLASFKPIAAYYHYLSMVKSNVREIERENVKLKKYMYSLRPLLCEKWVIEKQTQPPILFNELLDLYHPNGNVRQEINNLLEQKRTSGESKTVPQNQLLNDYITEQLDQMEDSVPTTTEKTNIDYDFVLRQIVRSE
jgi:predicted nucleotidyltransferase